MNLQEFLDKSKVALTSLGTKSLAEIEKSAVAAIGQKTAAAITGQPVSGASYAAQPDQYVQPYIAVQPDGTPLVYNQALALLSPTNTSTAQAQGVPVWVWAAAGVGVVGLVVVLTRR